MKHLKDEKTPFERVSEFIDEIVDPEAMTQGEYLEFLEELETDIAGRLESLEEEMADGEADDGLEEP
jgi:hypothetical protein